MLSHFESHLFNWFIDSGFVIVDRKWLFGHANLTHDLIDFRSGLMLFELIVIVCCRALNIRCQLHIGMSILETCQFSISCLLFLRGILCMLSDQCILCCSLHFFEELCNTKCEQSAKGGITFRLDMPLFFHGTKDTKLN